MDEQHRNYFQSRLNGAGVPVYGDNGELVMLAKTEAQLTDVFLATNSRHFGPTFFPENRGLYFKSETNKPETNKPGVANHFASCLAAGGVVPVFGDNGELCMHAETEDQLHEVAGSMGAHPESHHFYPERRVSTFKPKNR